MNACDNLPLNANNTIDPRPITFAPTEPPYETRLFDQAVIAFIEAHVASNIRLASQGYSGMDMTDSKKTVKKAREFATVMMEARQ